MVIIVTFWSESSCETILSGNWEVPLDQFIAQTSDPIYWSVIATALMHAMLKEVKSDISEQDQGTIRKRIQQLGELSYLFISKAYAVDQAKTVMLLKEARIGGFSIIGESNVDSLQPYFDVYRRPYDEGYPDVCRNSYVVFDTNGQYYLNVTSLRLKVINVVL